MNNEEKILSLLEKMDIRLSSLEKGQTETNQRLDQMDSRLDKVETRLDHIESDVNTLKKDVRDIKVDLKSVWADILRLDNRTQGLREVK